MPRFAPSLVAAVAFGAAFPIGASALGHLDPFHLTSIRYGVAALAFLALLWIVEGRGAVRAASRRRALELWALGTAGFAGFNLLAYEGLQDSTPQHAAVIVALMPVLRCSAAGRSPAWRRERRASASPSSHSAMPRS